MALQPYAGLVGPAYQGASVYGDKELLVNWYPEAIESPDAPVRAVLVPTPGVSPTVGAITTPAPSRGILNAGGRVFYVAGGGFYEINVSSTPMTAKLWHTLSSDGNPATLSWNGVTGHQVFVTSGGNGYVFDLNTNAWSGVNVTTPVTHGAFLKGFFIALNPTINAYSISALNDGTNWNWLSGGPGQFIRAEGADPWQALYVVNGLIYLIGQFTSEVHQDQGTSPFPFGPIQEAFIEQGTCAPFSGAIIGSGGTSSLAWIAQNEAGHGTLVRTVGYVPGRISTHAIETQLDLAPLLTDAVADVYEQRGHPHYVLNLPGAGRTFVFDAMTTWWHERSTWNPATSTASIWGPRHFASLPNQILCGNGLTGAMGTLSATVSTEIDGSLIRRMRQPPRFDTQQERRTFHSFQLVMDVGLGLATGQGSVPQMMLQVSRDAGQTWGLERWSTSGKMGQYGTRVLWRQLGRMRNFVPRIITTDPVPARLAGAWVDVSRS